MTEARPTELPLPYVAAFAAGAAALIFESTIARTLAPYVGATPVAATAVISAFLAALAIGAFVGGRLADRVKASARSGRVGSRLHHSPFQLARTAAIVAAVLAAAAPRAASWLGVEFTVGAGSSWSIGLVLFTLTFAVVFVPALAMGAPTAAIVAAVGRSKSGALYAVNTAGGVLGVVLASFVLVERVGVATSCAIAAATFVVVAVLSQIASNREDTAVLAAPAEPSNRESPSAESESSRSESHEARSAFSLSPALFALACGLGGLGVEVLGLRALHQVLPGSSHSLAVALAIFLFANALGAWLASRAPAWLASPTVAPFVAAMLSPALLLAIVLPVPLADRFGVLVVRDPLAQLVVALALAPGALVSGAGFALALRAMRVRAAGESFGRVTLANTIGSLMAAIGVGIFVLPALGQGKAAFVVACGVAVAIACACRHRFGLVAAAGALLVGAIPLVLDLRALPPLLPGDVVVSYTEGASANVLVVRGENDDRPGLILNRTARQGGGAAGERVEKRQGLLPALLHPRPNRALVLGVGTGATIEGLLGAGTRSVDAVEIVPEVLDQLGHFPGSQGDLRSHPNVTLLTDDAIVFAARAKASYDLVVGDLYFPWTEGASLLYSAEHFENVRDRLADGGVFWQWIPLHQLRFEDFGRIGETFRSVFSDTLVVLADPEAPLPIVALVGSVDPIRFSKTRLDASIATSTLARTLGLATAEDVFELYLGDHHTLAARFGSSSGRVDLDERISFDRPRIEFLAARTTEPEAVLALNNLNNLALQLGDTIEPWIELPTEWSAEQRNPYLLALRTRASALRQFLLGHYWERRGRYSTDDVLGDEQRESEQYQKVLIIDPKHAATTRSIDRLLRKRLAERRYQQVVELGRLVLRQNPEDRAAARNVGLALLLLEQTADAVQVLTLADSGGEADSFALTALCVALYLERRDTEASVAADRAIVAAGAATNNLASAVKFAASGQLDAARVALSRVLEHPQWGGLAKRIAARIES